MKFMILVKSNPDLEARLAATSDAEMDASMAAMKVFNDELIKAGVLKDCDRPSTPPARASECVSMAPRAPSLTVRSRRPRRRLLDLGAAFDRRGGGVGQSGARTRCPRRPRSRSGRSELAPPGAPAGAFAWARPEGSDTRVACPRLPPVERAPRPVHASAFRSSPGGVPCRAQGSG